MIAALKAEFRKIFSVRSTWVLILFAFLIAVGLMGFWIYGYKDVTKAAANPSLLADYILTAVAVAGTFLSFLAVLAVGHEYRYSTIMYSLTSSNRRGKVYVSKLLVTVLVSLVAIAAIVAIGVVAVYIGLNVAGVEAAAQKFNVWELLWRSGVYMAASLAFAVFITVILRSLIAAIAVILVLPSTVEPLLTLLLKENTKYLPYTSLGKLPEHGAEGLSTNLAVVAVYVAVLGTVSYVLFLKRDAN